MLQEALLCNRAASNLELSEFTHAVSQNHSLMLYQENYGSVLRDCSRALTINPRSSKAFYRSSLALMSLERFEEAIDCCDRCLSYDVDNKGVQIVLERASKSKAQKDKKEKERQERLQREQAAKLQMNIAFRVRSSFPQSKTYC